MPSASQRGRVGEQHRRSHRLRRPCADEGARPGGQPAGDRRPDEDEEAGQVDPLVPDEVPEPAAGEQEPAHQHQVGHRDPLGRAQVHRQLAHDHRHDRIDDRRVERGHEGAHPHRGEHPPLAVGTQPEPLGRGQHQQVESGIHARTEASVDRIRCDRNDRSLTKPSIGSKAPSPSEVARGTGLGRGDEGDGPTLSRPTSRQMREGSSGAASRSCSGQPGSRPTPGRAPAGAPAPAQS